MTYREAATRTLRKRGPMHYQDLAAAIISEGSVQTSGATPAATLNAIIAVDIRRKGMEKVFIRIRPGLFGLRAMHEPAAQVTPAPTPAPADLDATGEEPAGNANLRVRIPLFPVYSEARHLLRLWPGYLRKQVTGLQATLNELRGTPQKTVDWTAPSTWISERLQGGDRELARAIWDGSKGAVNPRHTYGHWLLAQRYNLLRVDDDGVLQLTKTGRAFLEQPGGEVESAIDEAEGLTKLLSIVADSGPARAGGLVEEWTDYLSRRSLFKTESTVKDTMRRRLTNLLERGLVERNGSLYSATPSGLAYLQSVREVVQVKRHRRPVQRKDLDALRGSLYRFNAVRGTIVTTSRFAKGTQQAAFATGTAPITLIDGDKLIDLLIRHGIGVRKLPIKLLEVDAEALAAVQKAD